MCKDVSSGYHTGYVYGSGRQVKQWHGYEIDFENVEDMVAYVINDIESTYENHKDSSKDGYPLEIVVLYTMNKKAIVENDDPQRVQCVKFPFIVSIKKSLK